MCACIMTINGSQCKCLLLDFRQVTKNIFVVFAIRFRVQSHIVDSSESQHCQLVLFVKPGFQFELRIGESRQEREVEHIKQELQIRLTYRYQIRGLFPDMPVGGERDFGCSEGSLYRVVLHISVAQLVKVYTHDNNRTVIGTKVPEAVLMTYEDEKEALRCAEDAVAWADVIVVGPGLGTSHLAQSIIRYIICESEQPLVVDADALNILSGDMDILRGHRSEVVVTPHLGEMSRLTGISIPEIKKNILKVCKDFAMEYNVIDVLKDSKTCVSNGDRDIYINTSGNNGMSTAGAGDVLTGVIAGFIATGLTPYDAAKLGVYVHGLAGDLAAERMGKNGMIARDIVESIPMVIKGVENEKL